MPRSMTGHLGDKEKMQYFCYTNKKYIRTD